MGPQATPAPTTRASLALDHDSIRFLEQLHRAWSERASSSIYAQLRDELLLQRDIVDNQVAALSTVVKIAHPDRLAVDAQWQEFFTLAKSIDDQERTRKREYHEANRLRNYLIVAAFWSLPVLVHYGWDKVGQTQMYTLRACATRYPRFLVDLCPRLNSVLLNRHRQGIKTGRVKTLNEASIQISRDLNLPSLASATPHDGGDGPWLTDESGQFPLETGGQSLSQLRPAHFRSYLLAKDCFGVLVARDQGFFQQPRLETNLPSVNADSVHHRLASRSSEPTSTPQSTVTTPGFWNPLIGDCSAAHWYSHEPPTIPTQPQTFALDTQSYSPIAASPGISDNLGDRFSTSSEPGRLHDTWSHSDCGFSPLQLSESCSDLTGGSRDGSPSDVDVVASSTMHTSLSCGPAENTQSALATTVEVDTDPQTGTDTEMDDSVSEITMRSSPSNSSVSTTTDRTELKSAAFVRARPTIGMLKLAPSGQQKRLESRSSRRSNLSVASPSVSTPIPPTMEETLQSRYHDLLQYYATKFAKEARHPDSSQQRKNRAQWFNSTTRWASIWAQPEGRLPRGTALSADEAEVLYYTSDEFIKAAQKDQIFNKTIIVKEKFMDSEMHTIDGLVSLLNDAPSDAVIEIRMLDGLHPAKIPVDEFVRGIRTYCLDSVHTLNLRSITNCHQPLFTMLPRFRLFKTLVERVEGSTLGKRIVSTPVDGAGFTGFNSISSAGAFSGPQLNSLCGTWMRNLTGIALCMIIPQEDMETQWSSFAEHGYGWAPNERQRLVLLEHDDVLLLPPGLRVVHAVQSLTSSLTEGGVLWDELNIIQTLESVHWICKNQTTANKTFAHELPYIIAELEKLVTDQPDRFRGQISKLEFLGRFDEEVSTLKNLGCDCRHEICDEWCECRQEGRRCTVWCTGHQQTGSLSCTGYIVTD